MLQTCLLPRRPITILNRQRRPLRLSACTIRAVAIHQLAREDRHRYSITRLVMHRQHEYRFLTTQNNYAGTKRQILR